jgi:hypothetical protein
VNVGHTLLCIVDWSTAKSQKHAYDNIYDRMLSRIELSYITDLRIRYRIDLMLTQSTWEIDEVTLKKSVPSKDR